MCKLQMSSQAHTSILGWVYLAPENALKCDEFIVQRRPSAARHMHVSSKSVSALEQLPCSREKDTWAGKLEWLQMLRPDETYRTREHGL